MRKYFLLFSSLIFFSCNNPSKSSTFKVESFNDIGVHLNEDELIDNFFPQFDIILLGDSIIERGESFELIEFESLSNLGVGGNTVTDINNRIDYIISLRPKVVFIMIGINDIFNNTDTESIFTTYKLIINKLITNNITPHIMSTLKVGSNQINFKEKNNNVEILNSLLKKYCDDNLIEFIDLNLIFSDGNKLFEKYTNDGVHLNSDGIKYLSNILNLKINELNIK